MSQCPLEQVGFLGLATYLGKDPKLKKLKVAHTIKQEKEEKKATSYALAKALSMNTHLESVDFSVIQRSNLFPISY